MTVASRFGDTAASAAQTVSSEHPTTTGVIALANLQAQIDGLERQARMGRPSVDRQAELIELVSLRGHVLGRIADLESAAARAEQLTNDAPADGVAFLARARARGRFHRFADALADLDEAQRLGIDSLHVDVERAAIFQATGQYDLALTIYREAARRRADFKSLGALATLRAERGEIDAADRLYGDTRNRYRGVSPFPLAALDFQRGAMWLAHGDLESALIWFGAAHRRLPDYAPAQGHLAEVEAALGRIDSALLRLRPLAASSDDPDYASSLARVLNQMGCGEEARAWQARAATRYDELVERHLAAFADHAAEFWLDSGTHAHRALWLARQNLKARQTPRAHELVRRATLALGSAEGSDDEISRD